MSNSSRYSVVIAIELGASTSGYSYAFQYGERTIIHYNKWKGVTPEGKTITAILLNANLEFMAFGYEANMKFLSKDGSDLLYFSNFLPVYKEGAMVKASNCDVEIQAGKLAAFCLKAIKDSALAQINKASILTLELNSIQWVITVPAIWGLATKQVLAQAAKSAGIPQENILFTIEPECAILYCLEQRLRLTGSDTIVVDAGRELVKVTVHRRMEDGTFIKLLPPISGNWGSSQINHKFEEFLEGLLGKEQIQKANPQDWYEVLDYFKTIKMKFNPKNAISNIPISDFLQSSQSINYIKTQINNFNARNGTKLTFARGILNLNSVMPLLYEPVLASIVNQISTILANTVFQQIKNICLVGEFAESPMLQARIEREFASKVNVVVPVYPGKAVLSGAVLYGLSRA